MEDDKNLPYKKMGVMLFISFIVMYTVMFLNVASVDHIYFSFTRTYMAILMVAPMAIMMLLLMKNNFKDKKINSTIIISAVLIFVIVLFLLRAQIPVGDEQYMQAMIPHHSSAILTSENANLQDPEVRELADQIIETQKIEIEQMKKLLSK